VLGDNGQGPQGESAAWFNCGTPGSFFLTRAFVRTLPVTLNGVRRVSRGWDRAASGGLNQPTSLEFIGNTAYVVALGGESWKIDGVSSPPYGIAR
jgi:hypothetical protein